MHKLVVRGVSGCGKSTLGGALAREIGYVLIEGDEHHLPASKAKMRLGTPLIDADREPWLDQLGALVAAERGGAVLTCSALKRSYRERLRVKVPALKFVFIEIEQADAVAHILPHARRHRQSALRCSPVPQAWPARGCQSSKPKLYNPRHPERTLLYKTIAEHFETWHALASAGQFDGQGDHHTPRSYIRQAFRKYLECGIFAHGFALNGHVHFHVCVVDGVFEGVPGVVDADVQGSPPGVIFHPASAIDAAGVTQVQATLRRRTTCGQR
jgi:carbohydrate kinase (thermoresistant glucokinase family)